MKSSVTSRQLRLCCSEVDVRLTATTRTTTNATLHSLLKTCKNGLDFGFDGSHHSLKDFGEEIAKLIFHLLIGLLIHTTLVRQALAPGPDTIGRVASASSSLISLRFFINRLRELLHRSDDTNV